MKTSGITDIVLERERTDAFNDVIYEKIPVSVDWSYESSEYGDGSLDEEFWIEKAVDRDENMVCLSEREKESLFETLKNEGAFD